MAKKIDQKKKKQRIILLAAGAACVILLCFFLLSALIGLFTKPAKQETSDASVSKPERIVAKTKKEYKKYKVDESGRVPIMMYHGIHGDIKSKETDYTGGNVDADGYNRTADAFEKDLEMYYKEGYRMIRLNDYIDGKVDVDAGKSPLILTFDDGHANNILVKGKDENGELEIDPKSAVGILEKFKEKYPDFNVTATFFINQTKFNQPKYDDEIIKWLVKHGYDVGNHTASHPDLTEITQKETNDEVGVVYDLLEEVIPGKYVKIVALPFGSPYQYDHENMKKVYDCKYNGKKYHTKSALQVAWEPDESPYSKKFTPSFLKRIRGYDNGGEYFDIEYTFTLLESTRYISDGDVKTCVVPKDKKDLIDKKFKKQIKTY